MFAGKAKILTTALVAVLAMAANVALANPVVITTPFMNLEHRAINSLGFNAGEFVRFGAVSVTPNGNNGTTGLASQIDLATGNVLRTRAINFNPSPTIPNFFSRVLSDVPSLRGTWDLTFTNTVNTTDSATRRVSLDSSVSQAPFVESITLSGSSDRPIFGWAPPPGTTVNGYRINIYDKAIINNDPSKGPLNGGVVVGRDFAPSVNKYEVKPEDFLVAGYKFALDRNYSIEISVLQTRDDTGNTSNANLKAVARAYADFTPHAGGGPVVNLPVVRIDGVYQFNMAIEANKLYYIDPEVAIGYIYAIGAGDPNFRSVVLPTHIGDGLYDLWADDGLGGWTLLADDIAGGLAFDFGVDGIRRFRVTEIETSAGLDPKNTTAFVTGLTFIGSGKFTGTQAPITANVTLPEAPTLALVLMGWMAVVARRKHRRLVA